MYPSGSSTVILGCRSLLRSAPNLYARRCTSIISPVSKAGIKTTSEKSFSVFPRIEDVNPVDIVGHKSFGFGTYFVRRSVTGNLPVYTDFKAGGNKMVTEIRKIDGDIIQLRNDMQLDLPHIPKDSWKVVMQSKKIVVKGDFVRDLKRVLQKKF